MADKKLMYKTSTKHFRHHREIRTSKNGFNFFLPCFVFVKSTIYLILKNIYYCNCCGSQVKTFICLGHSWVSIAIKNNLLWKLHKQSVMGKKFKNLTLKAGQFFFLWTDKSKFELLGSNRIAYVRWKSVERLDDACMFPTDICMVAGLL